MNIIFLLAPFSLGIALIALAAFWWTVRDGQYDVPAGDAARILVDGGDDAPLA
jgi:cbb3-type cytochrome oxidase maturation protein